MRHHPFAHPTLLLTQNKHAPYKTHQLYLHGFQSILKLFTKRLFPYISKCIEFIFFEVFCFCRSRGPWTFRSKTSDHSLLISPPPSVSPPFLNLHKSTKMAPKRPRRPYTEEDMVSAIFNITDN